MSGQLGTLGTGILTLITLVRFLSSVRSDMNGEVGSVLEDFPTVFTGVIPLVETLQSPSPLHDVSHQTWFHRRQLDVNSRVLRGGAHFWFVVLPDGQVLGHVVLVLLFLLLLLHVVVV